MQVLRKIAFPFSLLYALIVFLRNQFYNIGLFSSRQYNTPTICVGNLSLGGTGKTPMIEWLIEKIGQNRQIAVLSRGYKRNTKGLVLATPDSTVLEIGDEPLQIATKFPELTLVVDADRRRGISYLEQEVKPHLILLDDAMQHRKVRPTFTLLLTAYGGLYCDDWYLPTGNLRDWKGAAKRADAIVVTKCPEDLNDEAQSRIVARLRPEAYQEVFFAHLAYDHQLRSKGQLLSIDALKDREITLVTGIANPQSLVDFLNEQRIAFSHLAFGDHHFFTAKQIAYFRTKPLILTTEKDYMRLKSELDNVYYIEVRHKFIEKGGKKLSSLLAGL